MALVSKGSWCFSTFAKILSMILKRKKTAPQHGWTTKPFIWNQEANNYITIIDWLIDLMRHVFYFFLQWTKRVMQRFLSNTEHKLPVDVSQNSPVSFTQRNIVISPNLDFSGESLKFPSLKGENPIIKTSTSTQQVQSLDVLKMALVDSNPLIAWQKSKLQFPTLQVFLFEAFGTERNLFQPDVYIPRKDKNMDTKNDGLEKRVGLLGKIWLFFSYLC